MVVFGISNSAIGVGFRRQGVIANNLANSVTTGFKSSRVDLVDLRHGGVGIGAIRQLLGQGPIEVTGLATDFAVDGNGFFMLRDATGRPVFTRDGTFGLDAQQRLVNPANGFAVQGAGGPISIPLGNLTTARATSTATFGGNLNGAGLRAADGTVAVSGVFTDGGGFPATAGTLLTDLAGLGLSAGDTISLGATKGGRALPPATFTVEAGSTLGDLAAFSESSLGINTTSGLFGATRTNGTATTVAPGSIVEAGTDFMAAGVQVGDVVVFDTGNGAGQRATITSITGTFTPMDTLNFAPFPGTLPQPVAGDSFSVHEPPQVSVSGGQLRIAGNVGAANDIGNVTLTSGGQSLTSFNTLVSASGESGFTTAVVYDSLGKPRTVDVTFALESQGPGGNTFRVFAESAGKVVGTGTVSFNTQGGFAGGSTTFTLSIPNQGAATPLTVSADFSALSGFAGGSQAFMTDQDGLSMGTLRDFTVGANGSITGIFSNGTTQPLAQFQLARFANPNGLIAEGGNFFSQGPDSGPAVIGAAGTAGLGQIRSGALEGSNVELARELTGQIVNKSFTSANIKIIKAQDEMLGEVIDITR